MPDPFIDAGSPGAEIVPSDTRLQDAVRILMQIESGQGTPADLERYVQLSHGYYSDQLKDPTKALDPALQEAVLHHRIASEGGPVGLMGFCVAQQQRHITEAARMHQANAPKTRDGYVFKAQNWARMMSQISPQGVQGAAPVTPSPSMGNITG